MPSCDLSGPEPTCIGLGAARVLEAASAPVTVARKGHLGYCQAILGTLRLCRSPARKQWGGFGPWWVQH
jgi:hypothetical protein